MRLKSIETENMSPFKYENQIISDDYDNEVMRFIYKLALVL